MIEIIFKVWGKRATFKTKAQNNSESILWVDLVSRTGTWRIEQYLGDSRMIRKSWHKGGGGEAGPWAPPLDPLMLVNSR